MKKLAIIAIAAVAGAASAVVYENGPVTNGNSGGVGGNQPNSILTAPESLFGFGCQTTAGNIMADNFTVTGAGWNISRIAFYSYQTGATAFSFTGANLSIVTGSDPNLGTVVLNMTNAAVADDGFVGYRVTSTTLTNTTRPIFRVGVAAAVNLAPGNYMLRWSLAGSLASGPWAPPVVPVPANGGNGWQAIANGAFAPAIDAGSTLRQDLPFRITYTAVPEPATMLALGAGLAAIAARRRRK